jgi:hypothetical protein
MVIGLTRYGRLAAVVLAVVAAHAWFTHTVARHWSASAPSAPPLARMQVSYVRSMVLAPPPVVGAPAPVAFPPRPAVVKKAAPSKSVTAPAASAPEPAPTPSVVAVAASATAVSATPAFAPEPAASAPKPAASVPASAASTPGPPFEWPASTRLSYTLTGNYRGEVSGSAQVEWLRQGDRYQVHFDLIVGPRFLPLIRRRMSSDGQLTTTGLVPRQYEQNTEIITRDAQRAVVSFTPSAVVLASGRQRANPVGVQDSASQFVQLAYLFSLQPPRAGQAITLPLALPYALRSWTYDVVGEELVHTPMGPLPTVHLQPRNASSQPGDLRAEIWVAPQLRYLPVRIRIEQDAQTYLDLLLRQAPEIAETW